MWEPYEVKAQTIKTAIESATLLLRIDDIVSGIQKKNKMAPGQSSAPQAEDPDQVCTDTRQWPLQAPHLRANVLHVHKHQAMLCLRMISAGRHAPWSCMTHTGPFSIMLV